MLICQFIYKSYLFSVFFNDLLSSIVDNLCNDLFIKQSKTDHLDISLFNINGENVDINLEYFNDNIFANLTNLHSGLYCIRISNDKSSITKVLIKE